MEVEVEVEVEVEGEVEGVRTKVGNPRGQRKAFSHLASLKSGEGWCTMHFWDEASSQNYENPKTSATSSIA